MPQGKELRTQAHEVRAEITENEIIFSGYAAVFNKLSVDMFGFREIVRPGAFKNHLAGREFDCRALFNHDSNHVLGRTKSGTLEVREDERGLFWRATAPNVQWARDLAESVKRGDIDQCSFGFYTIEDKWEEKEDYYLRELIEVEVDDVSIVTYPAYPDTSAGVNQRGEFRSAEKIMEEFKSKRQQKNAADELRDKKLKLLEKTI